MTCKTKRWMKILPALAVFGLLGCFTSPAVGQEDASKEQRPRETRNQPPADTDEQRPGTARQATGIR
jgi:hypothetical protein